MTSWYAIGISRWGRSRHGPSRFGKREFLQDFHGANDITNSTRSVKLKLKLIGVTWWSAHGAAPSSWNACKPTYYKSSAIALRIGDASFATAPAVCTIVMCQER